MPALDFPVWLLGNAILHRLRRRLGKQFDVIPRLDPVVAMKDVDLVLGVLAPDAIAQMPVAIQEPVLFPVRIERDDGLPEAAKSASPCLVARTNCARRSYIARDIMAEKLSSQWRATESSLI